MGTKLNGTNLPSNSKKKVPDPPSPKPKTSPKRSISVKDRKAKFDLAEKYRSQRNLKDLTKEKSRSKHERSCKKTAPEVIEDPIAKLMQEMHADLKEIKSDLKGNNAKINDLNEKVNWLESKGKETDLMNIDTFEEIKGELSQIK